MSLQLAGLEANYLVSIYTPFGFYVYKVSTLSCDRKCVSGVCATYIPRSLVLIDAVYDILAEDRVLSVLQNCESAYCTQLCDSATSGDVYCEYGIIIQNHNTPAEFIYVDIMSRFYRATYGAFYTLLELMCQIEYSASYAGICAAMHESRPITSLMLNEIHSRKNRRGRVGCNSYTSSAKYETALDNVIRDIYHKPNQRLGGFIREKRSFATSKDYSDSVACHTVYKHDIAAYALNAEPSRRQVIYATTWHDSRRVLIKESRTSAHNEMP